MSIANTICKVTLINATCHRYTFQSKKVLEYVQSHTIGRTLNLFAGKTIIKKGEYRVDTDTSMPLIDSHEGAENFLTYNTELFDTIIFDPPWNARKAREKYEGRFYGKYQRMKEDIVNTLKPGGRVISAGYKISYFGKKRGFTQENLLVVNPGGDINPFFVSVEVMNCR